MGESMTSAEFFSIVERLFEGDVDELQRELQRALNRTKITLVFTPNPEQIMIAHEDADFRETLEQGEILLPDGTQLVKAAQQAKKAGKVRQAPTHRLTGVDLLTWWLEQGREEQIATALIGGKSGVAEALAKKYDPEQTWCFGFSGYDSVANATPQEVQQMRTLIEQRRPKIVFVAFGAPWQERWSVQNREWLQEQGVKIVVVCGGAFDVLSPAHRLRRAPRWMQQLGLEWFFRLLQEPGRWKRQQRVLGFIQLSKQWIQE
jgi:N-acetylglucosaminyldiphosphoundecaprenol N-acetyl-beta-D-mannosaminyltransferase